VTHQVVAELVDQGEALAAAAGCGHVGDVGHGPLGEHAVTGAQLRSWHVVERGDADSTVFEEGTRRGGQGGPLVVGQHGDEMSRE